MGAAEDAAELAGEGEAGSEADPLEAGAEPEAAGVGDDGGGMISFWPTPILLGFASLLALTIAATVVLLRAAMAEMVSPALTV